ncbi:hypothetical protein RDG67_000694 [Vibrio cholerae]|uniref:hypothetical protein n=1 Tax=Vibrio cholerae TaxID=666 RepID=UPI000E6CCFC7|nr:hypothetical protein [Vibrio cholerae]EGR0490226.1 hypothetical protein [Vibrio cholerae]EGR0499537.1 hypothetical protein [Vibrio cholerae]EGR4423852.1 hypothetical protein [Vibrio cholerae]EJC1073654.1 hypothetical protein [Vibrio cholerae]ELE1937908.1 hypothetical protein [Vibrio cholerae]
MNKELEQAMAQLMAMSEEAKAALGSARNDLKELAELKKQSSELLNECLQLAELGPKSKFKQICEPDSALKNRDIYDIVHAINVLAMANTEVLFIYTNFAAHTNSLQVEVLPPRASLESDAPYRRLLNKTVYLDWNNALERLLAIESQLTELIIEAREAAEAKATEQAEVKA